MTAKPLFIPLKGEYFDAFARGEKDAEYRLYGPRWNERTCFVGRPVTLSRGYGKQRRMAGVIVGFSKYDPRELGHFNQDAILDCFGTLDRPIAGIAIEVTR